MKSKVDKQNVFALDCSGGFMEFPVVVGIVAANQNTLNKAYLQIRKDILNVEKALCTKREIKAKYIKRLSIATAVFDTLEKNEISFCAITLNSTDYETIKQSIKSEPEWKKKLDALLWFSCCKVLSKQTKVLPSCLILDLAYTRAQDQALFENTIKHLFGAVFQYTPITFAEDSQFSGAVNLADLVAGLLRKFTEIRQKYKDKIKSISMNDLQEDMRKLFRM